VSRWRRLRRLAAGREETLRTGIFEAHRSRFLRSATLVRAFYALQLYQLDNLASRWNRWVDLERLDGLWPLFWGPPENPQLTIAVVVMIFFLGTFSSILCPHRRIYRILAFLGLLLAGALSNSFGKIDHGHHAWIFVAFLLIFLPDGPPRKLAGSIGARQRYLLVFAGAQASFLLCYSLAGFWKLLAGLQRALAGEVGGLSPDGLAYLAADRLLQTGSESVLGPLVIEHPWLGWPLLVGGIYLELVAVVVVFRPSLLRPWGALIASLHLGSLLILTVGYLPNLLLAVPLLLAAPGGTRPPTLRSTLGNLPLFEWLGAVADRVTSKRAATSKRATG
jgi:hypothetical protein